MARKEDTVVTRVEIDGKQAINQLGKLEMEASELRQKLKEIKKGTDEWTQANNKLTETKTKISAVRKELGITGMTMQQLTRYQRELQREINTGATRGTAKYKELRAELLRVNGAIQTQRNELRQTSSFWSGFKNQFKSFALMAFAALGTQALIGKFQSLITGSAELSDAMSDVQKTTRLTQEQVEDLMSTFKSFNTRTPRRELLAMAEIAGRLGIKGKKDIEGFVRAADQVNVALGDVLGDTETVMKDMGKLTDVFGIQNVYGIEQAMLKVGSAINELGMASTANERNIVNFTRRLGGVAPIAGISIQNILGMGATLDSLGQTVEVSGTAISRLFIEMAKNAEKYAKFAKMEVADFVKLMKEDANEAFIQVLEGVKDNSDGITELAGTLGDLGLDGARVVGVFANLANNSDKLREQQKLANDAFKEGISVTNEFALKNENLAANLSKVQKWVNAVWMNGSFRGAIESTLSSLAKFIEIPVSETMEKQRIKLNALVMQLSEWNLTSEKRKRILDQIQSDYPDFLKNMDTEKVTYEQLAARLKEVNAEMVNRIMLQIKDEELTSAGLANAKARIALFEQELKINEHVYKLAEKNGKLDEIEGMSLKERVKLVSKYEIAKGNQLSKPVEDMLKHYNTLSKVVNKTNNDLEKTSESYKLLKDQLGEDLLENPNPNPNPNPDDDDPSGDPIGDPSKKLEEYLQKWREFRAAIIKIDADYQASLLEKDEQEMLKIFEKYNALEKAERNHIAKIQEIRSLTEEEAAEHQTRLGEIETLKLTELNAKREEFAKRDAEARAAAEERIRIAKLTDDEKEVEQVTQHYQELIDLALEYGMDITELTEMREMALDAIRQKWRDKEKKENDDRAKEDLEAERRLAEAKFQIMQAYSSMFGSAVELVGKKGQEMNAAQKVLALFQIGADTAMGIMKANMIALQAGAAAGPAGPAVYASTKLTMLASVLQAAARAKALLGQSSASGAQSESTRPGRNPSIGDRETGSRAFYHGGHTGGDMYGRFAGYVHQNEYVVPEYLMRDPYVADLTNVIEAERRNSTFQGGGFTETSTPRSSSTSDKYLSKEEGKAIVDTLVEELRQMRKTPLKSYTVLDEYEGQRKLLDAIRRNANL